jgi:hypothetical protein
MNWVQKGEDENFPREPTIVPEAPVDYPGEETRFPGRAWPERGRSQFPLGKSALPRGRRFLPEGNKRIPRGNPAQKGEECLCPREGGLFPREGRWFPKEMDCFPGEGRRFPCHPRHRAGGDGGFPREKLIHPASFCYQQQPFGVPTTSTKRGGDVFRKPFQQPGLGGDAGVVAIRFQGFAGGEGLGRFQAAVGKGVGAPTGLDDGVSV